MFCMTTILKPRNGSLLRLFYQKQFKNNKDIYHCNIHQIEENTNIKSKFWSSVQLIYADVHWSQRSTPYIPWLYCFTKFGQGMVDLVAAPSSWHKTEDILFESPVLLPISVTALLSIHLQHKIPWNTILKFTSF